MDEVNRCMLSKCRTETERGSPMATEPSFERNAVLLEVLQNHADAQLHRTGAERSEPVPVFPRQYEILISKLGSSAEEERGHFVQQCSLRPPTGSFQLEDTWRAGQVEDRISTEVVPAKAVLLPYLE